ncbi:MAG TPA: TetR/AcrR family transcriptional regulator [Acidimicrobiales bacterium]|nr:TetR/AcrR family transcriptional regulator [Acidimicrobiales bacterium]
MSAPTVAPPSGTRDRLLDATERCLRSSGIRRTTVIAVAQEAGVSRAWLYRLFPNKASLVVAALARTDETFWSNAHARVAAAQGIAAQVTEAVQLSREHQPRALLLQLKAEEPEAFAEIVGIGLREMMPGLAVFWHPYLEAARARGEVRADLNIARAGEWVMRMVLSLLTVPGEAVDVDDSTSVRFFVDEFLVTGFR